MKFNYRLLKKDMKVAVPVLLATTIIIIVTEAVMGKICPARMFLGIPCPGCGVTRAFALALKGQFREATIMHPLWIFLTILMVAFIVGRYMIEDKDKSDRLINILKKCFVILMILSVIYYIYRMIAWFPNRAPMLYEGDNLINNLSGKIKKIMLF